MSKLNFNIGDSILVLDENVSGTVKAINGNIITLDTEDGFQLDFHYSELVLKNNEGFFKKNIFRENALNTVILEKEQSQKKKSTKSRKKSNFETTMEVDLHIHQLTKSSRGMSNFDMLSLQLDTAKRKLEFAISKRIPKIVFIHGVGEGVLKLELSYLFGRYDNLKFYDANYQKYGSGATEVYIYQNSSKR